MNTARSAVYFYSFIVFTQAGPNAHKKTHCRVTQFLFS